MLLDILFFIVTGYCGRPIQMNAQHSSKQLVNCFRQPRCPKMCFLPCSMFCTKNQQQRLVKILSMQTRNLCGLLLLILSYIILLILHYIFHHSCYKIKTQLGLDMISGQITHRPRKTVQTVFYNVLRGWWYTITLFTLSDTCFSRSSKRQNDTPNRALLLYLSIDFRPRHPYIK